MATANSIAKYFFITVCPFFMKMINLNRLDKVLRPMGAIV